MRASSARRSPARSHATSEGMPSSPTMTVSGSPQVWVRRQLAVHGPIPRTDRSAGSAAASPAVEALDDADQRRAQQVFVSGFTTDLNGIVDAAVRRGEIRRPERAADVLHRLMGTLFYRFLFLHDPLDRDVVTREVDYAVAALARRTGR